uniref:Immunoglobulin V-set domain-containing protein n=1 Tax=Oryzias latipes TaxID=8090 RepID=A0A3P9IEN8_ORYLA
EKEIKIFLFYFWNEGFSAVAESYEINIEGLEGEQTSFLCSHKLASSRKKYFCKHPCNKDKDILATVEPGGRTVKGRLSLKDFGDGVFIVTFNPLQLSDTHLYYCCRAGKTKLTNWRGRKYKQGIGMSWTSACGRQRQDLDRHRTHKTS